MDEDGYAIGDPYASAAKMIDRKKKAEESKKSLKAKVARTGKYILENKEQVTKWEKKIKTLLCLCGLAFMAVRQGLPDKTSEYIPDVEIFQ